jgi:hypothetical protein
MFNYRRQNETAKLSSKTIDDDTCLRENVMSENVPEFELLVSRWDSGVSASLLIILRHHRTGSGAWIGRKQVGNTDSQFCGWQECFTRKQGNGDTIGQQVSIYLSSDHELILQRAYTRSP